MNTAIHRTSGSGGKDGATQNSICDSSKPTKHQASIIRKAFIHMEHHPHVPGCDWRGSKISCIGYSKR